MRACTTEGWMIRKLSPPEIQMGWFVYKYGPQGRTSVRSCVPLGEVKSSLPLRNVSLGFQLWITF